MDWKEFYFSPKGRINRKLFWLGPKSLELWYFILTLVTLGIFPILLMVLIYIPIIKNYKELSKEVEPIILLFPVVNLIYIRLSVMIKRLHDLNKSGWLYLIAIIPYINLLFFIYVSFFKGTDGENEYGADPLADLT